MSTFNSPVDIAAATLARSTTINNLDAAVAAAFALLPDETKLKLGTVQHAVDSGAADAYVVTLTHTPAAYTDGMRISMRPANTNTGASTINVNSLGVKSIRRVDSTATPAGSIMVGVPVDMVYSTTTGFFHIVGALGATGYTGTLPVGSGGTGQSSFTNGQLLIGNTTGNTLDKATLTAGTNVTVTNGAGAITIAAAGSVSTVSVASANGFAGTVATATSTPAITLTTTATGLLKGNGTAIAAAVSGTDIKTVNGNSLIGSGDIAVVGSGITRTARTSNTILALADSGKFFDVTSGTFSQTFEPAATLTNGWFCYYRNSGTGDVTLEPDGTELIDGLTNFVMYPGEARLIQCTGTALNSIVLSPFLKTFTATATFTKPPGYNYFGGLAWSAGASGERNNNVAGNARGGGGGGCVDFRLLASALAATETITIGAGGAVVTTVAGGNVGGDTTIGSLVTVKGAGFTGSYLAGGSAMASTAAASAPDGYAPATGAAAVANTSSGWGGAASSSDATAASGNSIYGGAAGGGCSASAVARAGGTSVFGGAGGAGVSAANGVDGTAPGGGGGATQTGTQSGAGARGEVRIYGIV